VQLQSGSDDYQNLLALLGLYGGSVNSDNTGNVAGFWQGVSYAPPEQIFRRAALIVGRRVPTADEINALKGASTAQLRTAIRNLMQGPGFHDFLVTGANDRLHTDAFLNGLFLNVAELGNAWAYPEAANKYYRLGQKNQGGYTAPLWIDHWVWGMAKAPLELIAHVIEEDRSYQEVVTADYMMMTPIVSELLRGGIEFEDEDNHLDYQPAKNQGQVLRDVRWNGNFVQGQGLRVKRHGDFIDYPHAGVLNTHSFLNRYPTTDTNRNRARSRWTHYHFLGVDIEKSAPRTTDPVALADTDNPTMNNPACMVCHELMDPVAGAFQNYGDEGWYRDGHQGEDALPSSYRDDTEEQLYQAGDLWYRDMRTPGFDGGIVNNPDYSLQWLGERIADDPRFATAAVKFWWPSVMGAEAARAPEEISDSDYSERLALFEEQNGFVEALGKKFNQGIEGGQSFNGKDLLTEMILSPWFTAAGVDDSTTSPPATVGNIGTRRLLTPEELEAKTTSLIGWKWGSNGDEDAWLYDSDYTNLTDKFGSYYGGIDSNGIKDRAREMSALMVSVAERQALVVTCPAVIIDFAKTNSNRLLFSDIEPEIEPDTEFVSSHLVSSVSLDDKQTFNDTFELSPGEKTLAIGLLKYVTYDIDDSHLYITDIEVVDPNGNLIWDADFSEYDQDNVSEGWDYIGLPNDGNCGDYSFSDDSFRFRRSGCTIDLPLSVSTAGRYEVTVSAWGVQAETSERLPKFSVSVKSDAASGQNNGPMKIKSKIVELYSQLHGVELDVNHPDVESSYELLLESWEDRKTIESDRTVPYAIEGCAGLSDTVYLDKDPSGISGGDRMALDKDPSGMKYAWISILIMLMTDFNYLHE